MSVLKSELINTTRAWDREKSTQLNELGLDLCVLVAQWLERPPDVREVMGSIHVGDSDFSPLQVRVMLISSLFTFPTNLKVYMTDFFLFPRSNLSNVLTSIAKKVFFSIAIFLSRVLMHQKHQISLPVGYKIARRKTGDWECL